MRRFNLKQRFIILIFIGLSSTTQAFCVTNNTNWFVNFGIYHKDWWMWHYHDIEPHSTRCIEDNLSAEQTLSYDITTSIYNLNATDVYHARLTAGALDNFTIYGFNNNWIYKIKPYASEKPAS